MNRERISSASVSLLPQIRFDTFLRLSSDYYINAVHTTLFEMIENKIRTLRDKVILGER